MQTYKPRGKIGIVTVWVFDHAVQIISGFNLLGEASSPSTQLPPPQFFSQLQFKIMAQTELMPVSKH